MMIDRDELVQTLENVCRSMTERKMDVRFRDGFAQAIIEVEGFKGSISQNETAPVNEVPIKQGSSVVKMRNILNSDKGRLYYLEERGYDKVIAVFAELDCEEKYTIKLTTQGDMTIGTVMKRPKSSYLKQWRLWDGNPTKKARNNYKWLPLEDDQ